MWSDDNLDDNTKDTIIFGIRVLAVIVLGFIGVAVPAFILGV